MGELTRRDFLAGAAAAAMPLPSASSLPVCVFSKHLHFLDWKEMAETAAQIGFDGVDLTVRPGGHVEPERVEKDLPRATEIIRAAGLSVPMVTAGIVDTQSPHAEKVLKTLDSLGIPLYRWGGFKWQEPTPILERLAQLKDDAARLAEWNARYRVAAMYHIHSGTDVGASVWDLWYIIKDLDRTRLGVNYDICHATIEGGLGAWLTTMRLVSPWIKGVAIKDFRWNQNSKGEWIAEKCPLGEGMVRFQRFLPLLKSTGFTGPIQVHYEYPLGGAESGARKIRIDKAQVVSAMRRDLDLLRKWMHEAQLH